MFDIKITGGTVVDGTGEAGRRADVGITGDRIEAIGDLSQAEAGRDIDAEGLTVSPGFIDTHVTRTPRCSPTRSTPRASCRASPPRSWGRTACHTAPCPPTTTESTDATCAASWATLPRGWTPAAWRHSARPTAARPPSTPRT